MKVFACLWSTPRDAIINEASHIISHRLGNHLDFTAVHKNHKPSNNPLLCTQYLEKLQVCLCLCLCLRLNV